MMSHQLRYYRKHHQNAQVYDVICILSPRRIFYVIRFFYQRWASSLVQDNHHNKEIIKISIYTISYIIIP